MTTHPTDPHPMTGRTPVTTTHSPPSPPGALVPATRWHLALVEPVEWPPGVLDAVVLDTPHPARPWRDRVRLALLLLGWLVALAAAAGLVWLTVAAVLSLIATVTAAIAWVQTHWLLCLLLVAGLLLLCGSGGASCTGLHCGGCRAGTDR